VGSFNGACLSVSVESFAASEAFRLLASTACSKRRRGLMWAAFFAGIAQLVEQLICNQQVVGSNPTAGSSLRWERSAKREGWRMCFGEAAL
jgi:hypothetical protein